MKGLKRLGFVFMVVILLFETASFLGIAPIKKTALAATYKRISAGKIKIGSYYVWEDGGIYASKSKKGKGRLIVKKPKESNAKLSGAVCNGRTIYYLIYRANDKSVDIDKTGLDNKGYADIYRIDVSGKNNKRMGSSSQGYGCNMEAYYNNSLYITIGKQDGSSPWIRDLYEFDLKKRQIKRAAKDITCILRENGRYLIGERQVGMAAWYREIMVYDAKTKKKSVLAKYSGEACFVGNNIYYSDVKKSAVGNYTSRYSIVPHLIKVYNPIKKSKKTLATVKAQFLYEITSKYAEYYRGESVNDMNYPSKYRYTFDTKEEVEIK